MKAASSYRSYARTMLSESRGSTIESARLHVYDSRLIEAAIVGSCAAIQYGHGHFTDGWLVQVRIRRRDGQSYQIDALKIGSHVILTVAV